MDHSTVDATRPVTKPKRLYLKIKQGLTDSLHLLGYSLVFTHLTFIPYVHAGPAGGNITGGAGDINHSGLTTTINQTSQNMAIDWQSFNVNVDERVQYIQPNASSVSLNRILSNTGSTIAGQIDANGHVILVNPNGVFFTATSVLNVGGIIASGLDISSADFMNGDYIFNEVLGTEGAVINSGTINAALGGNVALLGRRVENNGLISARLGSVNLAAGKQAVLTFDDNGLLGVRVSQEILQNELGVDAAVLNSGDINAAGGRVLLTGSVSKDVFSQAVNSGDLQQARSVVVNADGTFSLGAGADVVNTGNISVSSMDTAGQIVLLGENVTSSGALRADVTNGKGGEIELHANNTTLLTENSVASARAESRGTGGVVKILGDKVGLIDQSLVDVSGALGGGQILIGGDYQGKNVNICNASQTYVGQDVLLLNDALLNGNGGKTILWADNSTGFFGQISVRGGALSGDGGFVEVSGKESLMYRGSTDRSAPEGASGTLLLDPRNIFISATTTDDTQLDDGSILFADFVTGSATTDDYTISAGKIVTELQQGDVLLQANGLIDVNGAINATAGNTSSLSLQAGDDLTVDASINLQGGALSLTAGSAGCVAAGTCLRTGDSDLSINATLNSTGSITLNAADDISIDSAIGGTFNPSSVTIRAGDNITITSAGSITGNGAVALTASDATLASGAVTVVPFDTVFGNIDINGAITTNGGSFTAITDSGTFDSNTNISRIKTSIDATTNTVAGNVIISAAGVITLGSIETTNEGTGGISSGGNLNVTTTAGAINQSANNAADEQARLLRIAGSASFTALNDIGLGFYDTGGAYGNDFQNTVSFTGNNVTLRADHTINLGQSSAAGTLTLRSTGNGVDGQLIQTGAVSVNGVATLQANGDDIVLDNTGNNFSTVVITDASNVTLADTNAIALETTNTIGSLTVTANGAITDSNAITVTNATTLAAGAANNITLNNANDFGGAVTLNSGNDVTLNDVNNLILGAGTISGALVVDADGSITQAASTGLAVTGTSFFTSTLNDADILLDSTSNNLQGAINLSTSSGGNNGNITLHNAATVTTLGTVNAYGALTVTADHDLTLAGITNADYSAGGTNTRTLQLNFGQATSALSTFTLNTGAVISTSLDSDDTVNVAINSGSNNNIFNFNSGSALSTARGSITVTGGSNVNTVDTFNLYTSIAGTINAGNGNDVFNITTAGITITSLQGQGGNDTLAGLNNVANNWDITGNSTNNSGTLNGTVNFQTMESFTGGDLVDTFNINSTGLNITAINGGAGNDVLNAANENNYWTVSNANQGTNYSDANRTTARAAFSNIESLVGNAQIDDFLIGATGSIAAIDGGASAASTNINTLRARQGVSNVWNFSTATSGSLALVSLPATPYVTSFSNIQSFVGGGVGNEWADFSSSASVNINVGNYLGFTGVVGNNNITSTLTGQDNQTNAWSIGEVLNQNNVLSNGINDGQVTAGAGVLTFIDFNTLVGGNGVDNFIINTGGSITGSISGGVDTNINTLTGQNINNTWSVTGLNTGWLAVTGSLSRYVQDFYNIQRINGGNAVDTITVTSAGSITDINAGAGNDNISLAGVITGLLDGDAGSDSLIITRTGNQIVELGNRSTANLNVYQMESIIANSAYSNTLVGDNAPINIWDVISVNAGSVNDGITNTQFNNFSTITGGTGIDEVNIANNITTVNTGGGADIVTMTGGVVDRINLGADNDQFTISGASNVTTGVYGDADNDTFNVIGGTVGIFNGGSGNDTVAYANPVAITVGDSIGIGVSVNAIETISSVNGTLNARTGVTTTWNINGINQGSVFDSSDTAQVLSFSGFTTLNGGTGIDNFTVTGNGSVAGLITGGNSADTLTFNFASTVTPFGQINFDGGAGNDTVTLNGTLASFDQTYTPDVNLTFNAVANTYDQLAFTNGTNEYSLNYRDVSIVTDAVQGASLTVSGTVFGDQFNLGSDISGNLFQVNTNTPVHVLNTAIPNLVINGASNDTIDIGSNFNMGANNLRLIAGTITNSSNSTLTANNLVIDSLVTDMTDPLITNINDLALVNTTGAVTVTDTGGLNISQLSAGGLNLVAADTITAGGLISGADLDLSSTNGAINLGNAANNLTGGLSLTAVNGDVTLRNNSITNIDAISAQSLNINAVGTINGMGVIAVTGTTTLASTADIFLAAANDFNTVNITAANNVSLNDSDDLTLNNVSVTGAISTTSNGLVLGAVNAASVNFNAGTGNISDSNGGAVNITANNVVMRAETGIGSGDAIETQAGFLDVINTVSGNVNINNAGAVTLTNLVNVGNINYYNSQGNVTLDHVETDYFAVTGDLQMRVDNGSIYGIMPRVNAAGVPVDYINVNDIKAFSATIVTTQALGTFTRPIVMDINDSLTYVAIGGYRPVIYGDPDVINSSDLQANALGSIGAISGQQLIELESLADIDPAIFTAVRNYNYDDISIRMPSDQLYEDDEEEDR